MKTAIISILLAISPAVMAQGQPQAPGGAAPSGAAPGGAAPFDISAFLTSLTSQFGAPQSGAPATGAPQFGPPQFGPPSAPASGPPQIDWSKLMGPPAPGAPPSGAPVPFNFGMFPGGLWGGQQPAAPAAAPTGGQFNIQQLYGVFMQLLKYFQRLNPGKPFIAPPEPIIVKGPKQLAEGPLQLAEGPPRITQDPPSYFRGAPLAVANPKPIILPGLYGVNTRYIDNTASPKEYEWFRQNILSGIYKQIPQK